MTAALELWPLLAFALAVGWLLWWGSHNDALTKARQRRRRVMQRLARARNHDHGGQQ